MFYQRLLSFRNFYRTLLVFLSFFPFSLYASFIESTIGTAVVNDATATYYNPSALTLLKNPQIITLGTVSNFNSHFTGQVTQASTGFTQTGSSNAHTHYYLPSLYLGSPTNDKVFIGLAIVANNFNRDIQDTSILRYVQSGNSIQDIDIVPGIGVKINDCFSVGAGVNISHANFVLQPISGFPSFNIPDAQSRNTSSDTSWGGNLGFLIKPARWTLIGFNYRSAIGYQLTGKSVFEGNPGITSNNYHFKFWTPARSTLSINQFVTPKLGFIGTIQYIQWNILKNINIFNIATQIGARPVIIPEATAYFHLRNGWIFTLGNHYHVSPKWVVRFAASYAQSPGNSYYQISNGDNYILGVSTGYEITKHIILDGSYAYAFIKNQNIKINTGRNLVSGVNQGYRDSVSLKLTFYI